MRTLTTAQQGVAQYAKTQGDFVRVQVKDSGGTYRDLSTYPGFSSIVSVQWGNKVDDPTATCTVSVLRELGKLSLSPYVAGSAVNKGFDPGATAAPLIALSRDFIVEVAIMPQDKQPTSGDWTQFFHGKIDNVDPASGYNVQFTGRDQAGRLAQQYIKTEKVYSYAVDGGNLIPLQVWEGNQVYAAGDYLLPASRGDSDPGLNKFFKCSTAGTSGTVEPVWTTGSAQVDGSAKWDYVGAPSTSGHPVESVIQNILDDNRGSGDPAITLYVPTSPGWDITQYLQSRTFTLDAIRQLAQQIGWDTRYLWRAGTSQYELTLYCPDRTLANGTLWTFAPSDFAAPDSLPVDVSDIRNVWRGIYGDPADLYPDGTPKRKIRSVTDSTSVTQYGELFAEIQEDATSNIDTSTEMDSLLNAALSDCSQPTATMSVKLMRGFPWVELGDYYAFTADNVRFDSTLSLAITDYQHTFEKGKLTTQLGLRGKPSIGALTHISKTVHPVHKSTTALSGSHKLIVYQGTKTPSAVLQKVVGGQQIQLSQTFDKTIVAAEEYEHHLYPVSGTTLDSSTLLSVSKDRSVTPSALVPGRTYFYKTVPRFRNAERLVRGQPSAEFSFVAGYVEPQHLNPLTVGQYFDGPPNGSFEGRSNGADLPDNWSLVSGNWGPYFISPLLGDGIDVEWGGTTYDGAQALFFGGNPGSTAEIKSDAFPVKPSNPYTLSGQIQPLGSPTSGMTIRLAAEWLDSTLTTISTSNLDTDLTLITSGVWTLSESGLTSPSTAAYARIHISSLAAHCDAAVDTVRLIDQSFLSLAAVGSSPNADGATLSNGVLNLQPADATHSGVVKVPSANGLSVSSGSVAVALGTASTAGTVLVPTANGLSVSSGSVALAAAGASSAGAVTTGTQTFAGVKTFSSTIALETAWTNASLGSGWTSFGSTFAVSYSKDAIGWVHIRGIARATSAAQGVIFTLPSGLRPASEIWLNAFTTSSTTGGTQGNYELHVATSGNVYMATYTFGTFSGDIWFGGDTSFYVG